MLFDKDTPTPQISPTDNDTATELTPYLVKTAENTGVHISTIASPFISDLDKEKIIANEMQDPEID